MTTTQPRDTSAEYSAKITPEGIAKMRARIGIRTPRTEAKYERACEDTIRNFAFSFGDDNPLFCNPQYAKKTRWGSPIAPPIYVRFMGISEVKEIPPEEREKGRGALAGVHSFWAGDDIEWYRPIYPGDRLTVEDYLSDVEEKRSQFAGISVITRHREVYLNQRGELVALWHRSYVRTERQAAAARKAKFDIKRPYYTPEMMKEIDAAYEREEVRGATPRYWEDIQEGQEVAPVVHGPLTLTDMISFMGGSGMGLLSVHKIAYKTRKRHPGMFSTNDFGAPESIVRCHYDDGYAQKIGNPFAYDLGIMRQCWMSHVVTNWMGDDAWLWKLSSRIRSFNYLGDITYVKGKVAKKYTDQANGTLVDLDVWAENQRGQTIASGTAVVMLPSREFGPVILPKAPPGYEGVRPKAVDW